MDDLDMNSDGIPGDLGVICGSLSDVSSLHVNHEVEEGELARRYGVQITSNCDSADCDVQIFRPDDNEIVARYAPKSFKTENNIDDEIILNHPDDDDLIRRYGSFFLSHNKKESLVNSCVSLSGVSNEDTCNSNLATSASSVFRSHPQDESGFPVEKDMRFVEPSMMENEAEGSSNDSCSDRSDLEGVGLESPSLLSSEDEPSNTFEDGTATQPDCSSHNRSITFYNLCCNKEFFSSISIDSSMKETLKGLKHRSSIVRNSNPESLHRTRDCGGYPKKSRDRCRSKVLHNDNLVSVIYNLERIAQTMETRCIEARRSLRKNSSQGNLTKTASKLSADLNPLLNTSHNLLRKIHSHRP